ncbi:MAG: PH domain-containing protein, partial [Lachnospiraceae bacterium]
TLLYRIVDIRLTRTLAQKIFGTGTVTLFTRVDVNKHIELQNIKNPVEVKEYLSDLIEGIRNDKKVVGREFSGMMCNIHEGAVEEADMDMPDMDDDGIDDNEE